MPIHSSMPSLLLILCAFCSLKAQDDGTAKPAADTEFHPQGARPFKYDEIDVNEGVVQRVEFNSKKCNLTLKNRGTSAAHVDVSVYVLNQDGVVLWSQKEHWVIDTLDVGAKFAKDYDLSFAMPIELSMSKYSKSFDPTPKWFVVR